MNHPALGILEFNSIAQGMKAADEALKEAKVDVIVARTICPGKYILIINGDVDEVKSSVQKSTEAGEYHNVDSVVIPNLHPQIPGALGAVGEIENPDALGIVETFSAPSAIFSADAAVKTADVQLVEIRVANGIGGKSFYSLTGKEHNVRAAVNAGVEAVKETGLVMNYIIIPSPHSDLYRHIL
jgi:microcompartment protein CcmL/EutN